MTRIIDAAALDLREFIKPGDRLLWGQAAGEPQTLTEALVAQRAAIGPVSGFAGANFSSTFSPAHADHIQFVSYGALGSLRKMTKAGALHILPCNIGLIYRYIEMGIIGVDVVFVQVPPAGPDGTHSYGVINDYIQAAVAKARVVIAEVNDQVPQTHTDGRLPPGRIDVKIETSRPVVSVSPQPIGDLDRAMAKHIAAFIEDGATVQVGVGATPDAVLQLLSDRKDLGIHTGIVGDGLVDLTESGVVTNARKPFDVGISVTGALVGTERLYRFAHENPKLLLKTSYHTHGNTVLAQIPNLITINSALEVDLTGQVNAEQTGDEYLGGVGGQPDYVRGGHRAPGGHSIIALPATAKGGALSRIRATLTGPVTTPRSDVDVIVTEFGSADLRGLTIAQRVPRLIAVAHPDFREQLEREAHPLIKRGY